MRWEKSELALRLQGEFENSNIINNLIVSNVGGKPVYLRDIATIHDGLKDVKTFERANGGKTVRVMIQKQSDANTVTVAKLIKVKLEQIKKTLPPDVKVEVLMDSSTNTLSAINNLSETLIYALLFVVLVVIIFLGRSKPTFIISLSIPISLIVGFIYMYLSGGTLNIITLASLSIAIGLVVDDSIVVLENYYQETGKGRIRPRISYLWYERGESGGYSFHLDNCGGIPPVDNVRWHYRCTIQTSGMGCYHCGGHLCGRFTDPGSDAILQDARRNPARFHGYPE